MLFLHPMWDSESERIGMQKCTPAGYVIHAIGELIGFAGLLVLVGTMAFVGWKFFNRGFQAGLLWWMALPLAIGVVSEVMVAYSWRMAKMKGFHYDCEAGEASWMEAGERRTYKYESSR